MQFTAKTLADYLHGDIVGDENTVARTVARIEQGVPGAVCFLANPKYEAFLYTTRASIVLVNRSFEIRQPVSCTLIRVDNAYESVAALLELYNAMKSHHRKGRSWRARVSWRAKLGKAVWVGAGSYIARGARIGNNTKIFPQVYIGENVSIGNDCLIYPGVKIYHGCKIGNRCTIHANAVIGSDGFGFAPTADGSYRKIPQIGHVILEDDVEIGANAAIDRATIDATIVRRGVKIDNLVQIAHNVEVGEDTVIAALSGVAGSTKIGRQCMFGGQVGVAGHITVADGTRAGAQTGISATVKEPNQLLSGSPAINYYDYFKAFAIFRRLPQLKKQVEQMRTETEQRQNRDGTETEQRRNRDNRR
ncbi:MAG: UDP-3-O-(3-hydroxymyristoyl)glucosamine N-acyltransferase [Prevotellaceae bacterium]|jgi:UDP-3-O-[3-hydroxymyristoyl] glucosamine N-acyltransferase|nr:UDP-3-O-(3-hydroxymyristoyl)glucosamine N-acyltransferase [Prevotellaceae bacterium]